MKKYLVVFAFALSCTSTNPEEEALQTVKDFINWYEINYRQANSFGLVNQGDSIFYSVNFTETEKYLTYLKSSGLVSDSYVDHFRTYFNQAEEAFKKDPINEGPPPGFDYDIVLYTQEPELIFETKNNPVVLSSEVTGNQAMLLLDMGLKLKFNLSKINNIWMIDEISYPLE